MKNNKNNKTKPEPSIGSGGFVETEQTILNQKNNTMNFLQKYYPILLAFLSFLFSVSLWFGGMREEGLFVGIWVPSILGLANFFNTVNQKK